MLEVWPTYTKGKGLRFHRSQLGPQHPANDLIGSSRTQVFVFAFIHSPKQASGQLLNAGTDGMTMGILMALWIQPK